METRSEERLAKNEAFFRQVNERINEAAQGVQGEHTFDFLCECSDPACTARITLSKDEYESVREKGTRFVLAAGHIAPEIEHVVEREDNHVIVEKQGLAARIAAKLNPRTA